MTDDKPLSGWTHPDHLDGVTVITWVASGPDTLNDGARVVQIDTDLDVGRVRVNLNDGVIYDGNPEEDGYAVQALVDIADAMPDEGEDLDYDDLYAALAKIRSIVAIATLR